mgnify:CR=1 FL=1
MELLSKAPVMPPGVALDEVFDDDLQAADPVHPTEILEACFLGMAMGWSWALHLCQDALVTAIAAAGSPVIRMIVDGSPSPQRGGRGGRWLR